MAKTKIERPEIVEDEHLTYLDNLRESGVVNMFGATSYIIMKFSIDFLDATIILRYWMDSFGNENT